MDAAARPAERRLKMSGKIIDLTEIKALTERFLLMAKILEESALFMIATTIIAKGKKRQ